MMGELGAAGPTRPDVTLQRVGREAILHDAATGRAHVINASAARLWELCDGRPMDDLLKAFADPYGRQPDDVRADVERVLDGFRSLGLLVSSS
jgi:PqqD family protein of HPr-rel-A system